MFIVARSPKYALISLAVSIGIFLIVYFTVISPDNNAANKAANNAITQSEQQVNNAVNKAAKSGGVPSSVTNLAQCMTAAGTDTAKIQACTAKFQP